MNRTPSGTIVCVPILCFVKQGNLPAFNNSFDGSRRILRPLDIHRKSCDILGPSQSMQFQVATEEGRSGANYEAALPCAATPRSIEINRRSILKRIMSTPEALTIQLATCKSTRALFVTGGTLLPANLRNSLQHDQFP